MSVLNNILNDTVNWSSDPIIVCTSIILLLSQALIVIPWAGVKTVFSCLMLGGDKTFDLPSPTRQLKLYNQTHISYCRSGTSVATDGLNSTQARPCYSAGCMSRMGAFHAWRGPPLQLCTCKTMIWLTLIYGVRPETRLPNWQAWVARGRVLCDLVVNLLLCICAPGILSLEWSDPNRPKLAGPVLNPKT